MDMFVQELLTQNAWKMAYERHFKMEENDISLK